MIVKLAPLHILENLKDKLSSIKYRLMQKNSRQWEATFK